MNVDSKLDCIFISYDEENADENWQLLKKRVPTALRVHGIEGISAAHEIASSLAKTSFFFTIDGDNKIEDGFNFHIPDHLVSNAIYVWRCQNVVNGLIYGYGGVKLWDKRLFEKKNESLFTDHATEKTPNYKIVQSIASKTCFNTSPFMSWRSAFRECVKLYLNIREGKDAMAFERLKTWLTVGTHADHGDWCLLGAHYGVSLACSKSREELSLIINDFSNLKLVFSSLSTDKDPLILCTELCELFPAPFNSFKILAENESRRSSRNQRTVS